MKISIEEINPNEWLKVEFKVSPQQCYQLIGHQDIVGKNIKLDEPVTLEKDKSYRIVINDDEHVKYSFEAIETEAPTIFAASTHERLPD